MKETINTIYALQFGICLYLIGTTAFYGLYKTGFAGLTQLPIEVQTSMFAALLFGGVLTIAQMILQILKNR